MAVLWMTFVMAVSMLDGTTPLKSQVFILPLVTVDLRKLRGWPSYLE